MLDRGYLIALEGIDGSGTTTQVSRVGRRLSQEGYRVLATAEPSTYPIGRLLREYLGEEHALPGSELTPIMMSLLFTADRVEHYAHELLPAMRANKIVLCDRYMLSTSAYQTNNLDRYQWICELSRYVQEPDLSILLQIDPRVAAERLQYRKRQKEFYEEFHIQQSVAMNYERLLNLLPEKSMVAVNADRDEALITDDVCAIIKKLVNGQHV